MLLDPWRRSCPSWKHSWIVRIRQSLLSVIPKFRAEFVPPRDRTEHLERPEGPQIPSPELPPAQRIPKIPGVTVSTLGATDGLAFGGEFREKRQNLRQDFGPKPARVSLAQDDLGDFSWDPAMGEGKIPPGIWGKEHCFKCLWVLRISPCNEPPTSSSDRFGRE